MKSEDYSNVIKTEVDLIEALLGLMKQQQNAIVHFRDAEMTSIVERQHNILRPLEALEKERARMAQESHGVLGEEVQSLAHRLKQLGKQIVEVNKQNKVLLENSLRFIQKNIKIITEDYTRQLLDAKI